jgi:hypothetical protein
MTAGSKAARPRLWEWLQHQQPVEHSLLWCRTIDSFLFRDTVEQGLCEPHECEVFHEPLIYLFYGRPAFRIAEDNIAMGHSAPVVLVFESDLVNYALRMYPFDSGAFAAKRYANVMHKRMTLENFSLPVSLDAARKMVSVFFGSNIRYLRTAPRRPASRFNGEFEVKALVDLFSPAGRLEADDRRQAVELQVPTQIDFPGTSLAAIVYPDEFDEAEWFMPFAAALPRDVKRIPYPIYEDKVAKEYQTTLEGCVETVHKARGLE